MEQEVKEVLLSTSETDDCVSTAFELLEQWPPVAILIVYHMTARAHVYKYLSGCIEIIPGFSDSSSPQKFPNYAQHNFHTLSTQCTCCLHAH